MRAIPGFTFFGLQINSAHSYLFLFMAILFVLLVLTVYITNSKWGRAIKAVANNELAVEACGICLSTVKGLWPLRSAAYTAASRRTVRASDRLHQPVGLFHEAHDQVSDDADGRRHRQHGRQVLGAVLVTLLPELLRKFDNYYWLIFSAFMLVMAIFNPYGLLEIVRKITRYFRDITGKKAEKNG